LTFLIWLVRVFLSLTILAVAIHRSII
jgi:hypothetical protein